MINFIPFLHCGVKKMKHDVILDSISNITYEQCEAFRSTSNAIIYYESKVDYTDSYNNDTCDIFIVKEGRIFDVDGDELFIFNESYASNVKPTDASRFDFIGHDKNVGTENVAIAEILKEIFQYSKIYHHRNPSGGKDLLYNGTIFGSNLAKYQKTLDLMNMMESSKQNFCKLYYACDNVGKCNNHDAYVFFAELTLPSGVFFSSWHLMRDGIKSKNTNKITPKNKICNNIDSFSPTGNRVIKFGKKKVEDYEKMETRYNSLYQKGINGSVVLNKLLTAFNLPK